MKASWGIVASVLLLVQVRVEALAFTRAQQCRADISLCMGDSEKAESLTDLTQKMLRSHREMSEDLKQLEADRALDTGVAKAGDDGVYRITSRQQYSHFLATHSDKLAILKFTSPVCLACKKLKLKFKDWHQDPRFPSDKVVLADVTVHMSKNGKHLEDPFTSFVTSELGVAKIPLVRFYRNTEMVDSYVCHPKDGCSWTFLKQKMLDLVPSNPPAHEESSRNQHSQPQNSPFRWFQSIFNLHK